MTGKRNRKKALEREIEKQFKKELEAKLQSEKLAAQLELERLQFKRARVELENIETRAEVQSAASSQENMTEVTGLSGFMDGKDNLNSIAV